MNGVGLILRRISCSSVNTYIETQPFPSCAILRLMLQSLPPIHLQDEGTTPCWTWLFAHKYLTPEVCRQLELL